MPRKPEFTISASRRVAVIMILSLSGVALITVLSLAEEDLSGLFRAIVEWKK